MLIYILAEERTGSTWLANRLATKLNRVHAYIETSTNEEVNRTRLEIIAEDPIKYSDHRKVYHTHLFQALPILQTFTDQPLVIRTLRHDVIEQLLSYYMLKKASERVAGWQQRLPDYSADMVLANSPISLTSAEIHTFFAIKKQREQLWTDFKAPNKQTIYYEDMLHGVGIPALNVFLSNEDGPIKRTTYEKAKYFTNYEEIRGLAECYAQ